jgi:hypothetical protein
VKMRGMRVRIGLLCIAVTATLVPETACVRSPASQDSSGAATRPATRPLQSRHSFPAPIASRRYSLPAGIHNAVEEPPGYRLTNYWSNGTQGEEVLEVFAGKSDVLGSGVLVFNAWGSRFYPAQSKSVGLSIQDRRGPILLLVHRAGRRFLFDTLSRTFVAR